MFAEAPLAGKAPAGTTLEWMSSLFPDDAGLPSRRGSSSTGSRRFAPRSKAVEGEPSPLPAGWVLAHCDGGARGNPGPAGFGAVVTDDAGLPVAELSEFLGMRTNNFAEYSGLLAVLAWALEHGRPRVRVVSDSELMVKQIQGRYKVNSPDLRPLYEEAKRRIGQLDGFEILHALRHKNKVADRLANEAMDRGMGKAPGSNASPPSRATPYPVAGSAPPLSRQLDPSPKLPAKEVQAASAASSMLRGFVRDGVVHILGSERLREGAFVKIVPE